MKKSILVTGCAGFIGSNFVPIFHKQFPTTEIIGIDDFSTGRKNALDKDITFYEGSITNKELVQQIFERHKPEYVFHFAARPRVSLSVDQPVYTTDANILGTVTLLEASRDFKVKRFIYSSSSSIYGVAKKRPTPENSPANPLSPYALQKYTGEVFCKMASNIYGFDTVSLRYHNVFGPGQYGDSPYSSVVSAWLESIFFPDTKKAFIQGDGKQAKDMCFVEDVVSANISAMKYKKRFNGEAFNIAIGKKPLSINEIAKIIEKVTGQKLKLERRPARVGDVRFSHANISKAKKVLGFKPHTNFKECIEKTVEWFKTRKV